jgi:hypothetical protein
MRHGVQARNIPSLSWRLLLLILALGSFLLSVASAQTKVEDIFGRSLNEAGITLVDWDGYMANPLIKFYLLPPTNAVLPGNVTLTINGSRLYFENPGNVSTNGPSKTISLANSSSRVPVRLSIFPDHDGLDEDYVMTLVFTGVNSARQTNTIPIHVLDQDLARTNDFNVVINYDRDVTGFFTNVVRRSLVKQATEDWAYFFAGMALDVVPAGTESTYIWSNNFNGGYYFNNTNSYRGYQLYAYGTTNAAHRSGGEGNFNGAVQRSNGVALTIKRSGGFEAEIYGNYNTLGWLLLTNDNEWLTTGNLGNETNDFYTIAHHEIGHALIFNVAHPGFNYAKTNGGFRSFAVTNYYGAPVMIDPTDHLNGVIDPESGQGCFGYEYYGSIPRKRWLITKLDLLCAQEVGYGLRNFSAVEPLSFGTQTLASAAATVAYASSLKVLGGIPMYFWEITSGSLPPGLFLDSFSGVINGTPGTNGNFSFTLRVRDGHENGAGVTKVVNMVVGPAAPFSLNLMLQGTGQAQTAQLTLSGTQGQQQVVEASSNLVGWPPVATNLAGTNLFRLFETNIQQNGQRFYRARTISH